MISEKICVYMVSFGKYEQLTPQTPQTIPVDFKYFSDETIHHKGIQTNTCDLLPHQPSPVLKSKYLRVFPFKIKELDSYDIIIYIDGNITIKNPDFIEKLLTQFNISHYALSLAQHPDRTCAYDEAAYSRKLSKYSTVDLMKMMTRYKSKGFPAGGGLFQSGFLVYNRRSKKNLIPFQKMWWKEILRYNLDHNAFPQCQVSLPYVLWKKKMIVNTLPIFLHTELIVRPHGSK